MTKSATTLVLAAPAAMALAGCQEEAPLPTDTGETEASGEVLEGTISDEMLPIDQLRSQAPQADPEPEQAASSEEAPVESTAPAPAETTEPEIQPVPGIEIADQPEGGEDAGESAE